MKYIEHDSHHFENVAKASKYYEILREKVDYIYTDYGEKKYELKCVMSNLKDDSKFDSKRPVYCIFEFYLIIHKLGDFDVIDIPMLRALVRCAIEQTEKELGYWATYDGNKLYLEEVEKRIEKLEKLKANLTAKNIEG